MEIDPLYCDVIVQRWEEFSGKKADRAAGLPQTHAVLDEAKVQT